MIYYVDSVAGKPENDGLSEATPKHTYRALEIKPGDTVLIKAGSTFRDCLATPDGEEGKPITWDMYGEGAKPLFLGSFDASDPAMWTKTDDENIWAYTGAIENDVCNLIYGKDEECGVLAWEYEDLNAQGKWHYTHMGYDSPGRSIPASLADKPKVLYVYSVGNPAAFYGHIECAIFGHRCLLTGRCYVNINNMSGKYSGVHVYGQSFVKSVSIKNCEFRFIGGCVWDRIQHIRFGNGIEVWEYGEDVTVENCYFDEIYDSCITHQGFRNENPCVRINMINNIFKNYGMAAYELRDRIALDSHFDNNVCIGAGRGFSLQGEVPPRKSELWPQPMGHHLFIWRIYAPSENGCITVHGNIFHDAPYGAAVYSTIDPEAEKQLRFSNNVYYKDEDTYLIRLGGKNYGKNEFALYQAEQENDRGSRVEKLFS